MGKPIVYGPRYSTFTRSVIMTLLERKVAHEVEHVERATDAKQPAHLARHPFGVIPVLEDGSFVLLESRAIIRYLDARLAGPALVPADAQARARMDQWLSVDQSYVAPHVSALVGQRIVRPHLGQPSEPAAIDAAERALATALAIIDRALASERYLAGEAFSLADISLMPYIAGITAVQAGHLLADVRHVARWWAEVSARPAWQRAIGA